MRLKVASRTDVGQDTITFELVSPDGSVLPAFTAGAHVDVRGPSGHVRQYSLCNAPSEQHRYLIGVLHTQDSRGGSRGLHANVQAGDVIEISEPRNQFPLLATTHRTLLFGGGIGITPLLSMAEQLTAWGSPFELRYFSRSRSRAPFYDHLLAAPYAASVLFHFDDEPPVSGQTLEDLMTGQDMHGHLYMCGPGGFMTAVTQHARAAGWDDAHMHLESFVADPALSLGGECFEVELAKSGRIVMVSKDQTVVQALSEIGVIVPLSCEQGICGTCLTSVLAGRPDHKDLYLTDAEHACNDQFTPCCSRSLSPRLVLDL